MAQAENKEWTGKTGGTKWMQESLIGMFRHFDPLWLSPVIALWIVGYIVLQPKGTQGMYHYWRRRRGKNPISACWHLYATYFWFGLVIMDRFAAYGGRKYDIRIEGEDVLDEMMNSERGSIVLSSHIGNQELAGYSFEAKKPMHIMLYLGDTATVNENRERMFNRMGLYFLPMQADGSHIFAMHEVLEKGDILSIHADRMFYGQRSIRTMIMGEEAPYPEGPFKMAAMENTPVVTMHMMKESRNRYTLYVRKLANGCPEGLTKPQYARQILEAYVHTTEEMMDKYPHQWFHFYRFWQ